MRLRCCFGCIWPHDRLTFGLGRLLRTGLSRTQVVGDSTQDVLRMVAQRNRIQPSGGGEQRRCESLPLGEDGGKVGVDEVCESHRSAFCPRMKAASTFQRSLAVGLASRAGDR
jgi:hypothetical protein